MRPTTMLLCVDMHSVMMHKYPPPLTVAGNYHPPAKILLRGNFAFAVQNICFSGFIQYKVQHMSSRNPPPRSYVVNRNQLHHCETICPYTQL
jgi:hypothetical protein